MTLRQLLAIGIGLASGLGSTASAQATVFHVSPLGPIPDVQTAIAAAADGDLIEVAPGTYPAFTVSGKRLGIIGIDPATNTPATFDVQGAANTAAIRIEQLTPGQLVTISGARIHHVSTTAPAIVIDDNPAANVRLLDVVVTTLTALGNVPYDGVVEVRDSAGVWFDRVRIGDHRVFANGAAGTTGVAGVFCADSQLHFASCDCRGMRSANATIPGGDGLRIVGSSTAWLVDSLLMGGMSFAGAVPNTLGGHAVHDFGGAAGPIRACDCTLSPAVATVSWFAIAGVPAFLMACADASIGRTTLTPWTPTLAIGTATVVEVSADIGNRAFVLLLASGFDQVHVPALFDGALLVGGDVVGIAAGLLAATPFQTSLQLPFAPVGIGLQFTLQSALLAPGTTAWSLSMTTAAGFTVR